MSTRLKAMAMRLRKDNPLIKKFGGWTVARLRESLATKTTNKVKTCKEASQ
jgi:hypothetical protein